MGLAASRQEAFWESCSYGRIHKVKEYILEGIDVNWVSNIHDCCPIHVASQGKPEIVDLLLLAKCDVNARDIRGNLALHHAAMKGHSIIVEKLLLAGSDRDAQDKMGWTALHCATYWCHKDVVRILLENDCDVHIQNKDERTALHELARSPEKDEVILGEICEMLLLAGSNINAKSSDLGEADFTPLMFAAYHDHPEVASRLISAGCDLDASGTNGWTALHWAADRDNEELICLLIESGANPSIRALRKELAADRAKNPEMRTMLLNAHNLYNEIAVLDADPLIEPPSVRKSLCFSTSFRQQNRHSTSEGYPDKCHSRTSQGSQGDAKLGNFLNGFKVSDPDSADRLHQVTSLVEQVSKAQHPYDQENVIQGGGVDLILKQTDSNCTNGLIGDSLDGSDPESPEAVDVVRCLGRRESVSTDDNIDSDTESLSALSDSETGNGVCSRLRKELADRSDVDRPGSTSVPPSITVNHTDE